VQACHHASDVGGAARDLHQQEDRQEELLRLRSLAAGLQAHPRSGGRELYIPLHVQKHHREAVDTLIKKTLDANKTPVKIVRKSKISNVKRNVIYHSMDLAAQFEEQKRQGMNGMFYAVFGGHCVRADVHTLPSSQRVRARRNWPKSELKRIS
jgi:hypothetical protein